MTAVLLSHPHAAAVAGGLAANLARSGKLAAFVTGVAFAQNGWKGQLASAAAQHRRVLANRILPELASHQVLSLPAVELLARAAGRLVDRLDVPVRTYDVVFVGHDLAVSGLPWPRDLTHVYAYEDGALFTFRRAARAGLPRWWDLPTPHHVTVRGIFEEEARRWPDAAGLVVPGEPSWKQRRKDQELQLATTVTVASRFTKSSLERTGSGAPVVVVPYGFPVESFPARTIRPEGPFTVLSVGSHDLRKGTPYLLEAWKRAAIPDARLHLVGPLRLAKPFVDRYAGFFTHTPHLPRTELPPHYAAADLVVFPTLADGFGLVIQEAMSSGTPVLTTSSSGGPECITDDVEGWIVSPRDIDALVERIRQAARDRDRLFAMGRAARARAERWTWRDAGQAMVRALES